MIEFEVLGSPGRDNALLVTIDSGQRVGRLLFDCGQECLTTLSVSTIHAIDHLFFSHLHMDHVAGFDSFFRCTYNRDDRPNTIWGPEGTAERMQHRFRGFWWNLVEGQPGTWVVNDITEQRVCPHRFQLSDAFARCEDESPVQRSASNAPVLETPDFQVSALLLKHNGPCVGYLVKEKPRLNIRTDELERLGLAPGPWLKAVKDLEHREPIEVNGKTYPVAELREQLMEETRGEAIAYLTDFLIENETRPELIDFIEGCDVLVCESQYRHEDLELAQRNHHATATLVAQLARDARVGKLILFHLSDRYSTNEWKLILEEARDSFDRTSFPGHWSL